jgi:DNA adenine methylase
VTATAQLALDAAAPTTRVPAPEAPPATPIFKWAGGKRWLLPMCGPAIRAYLARSGGRYIEPFLGGGAFALWLGLPDALLGDLEAPLVESYATIAAAPTEVADELALLAARGMDRAHFEAVRGHVPARAAQRAARLLFLNKLAFNGLYRTNRSGAFNVNLGRHKSPPRFPTVEELQHVGAVLARARMLYSGDFQLLVTAAGPGDVVFADPPYYGGFRAYSRHGFNVADQERLATALRSAARRGAAVLATNADTPEVRQLYAWAEVLPTVERRAISCKAAQRRGADCLLLTTHPSLVWPPEGGSR